MFKSQSNIYISKNEKLRYYKVQVLLFTKDIMSEQAPTLKWGDIIRIHGVNLSKKDEQKTKGLIVSKGFTDPNIYYQKYDDFKDVIFYRESLFQILPRSNFDMHDQMMQPNLTTHQKQLLKTRAVNEIIGLQNSLKAKAGKQITYNSEVIFRHVQSQSYLRGILKAADTGQGAFKIEVTQSLSSQLIFRITSHRSYEHESDKIYYDDALLIYHTGADCFMNFAENIQAIYLDTPIQVKQIVKGHPYYQMANQRPSIKRPINNRIPIVNQNKSKCLWKFVQHCSFDEYNSKNKIKSHDIVYFMHTKAEGLVSSTLAKPSSYYLKEKGSELYYECFWQLIPREVNELGPEQCQSFWVRNVVTGQLLKFQDFNVEVQPQNSDDSEQGLQNKGLINLICSQPNQEGQTLKLERGSIQLIPEDYPVIVKKYEEKFQKISFIVVPKMSKDIFKIFKVDQKTLLDLQYALSSHQQLVKLIEVLSSGLIDHDDKTIKFNYPKFFMSLNQDILINIITILKMLIGKIYNVTYDQIVTSGNLPDKNMQKILVQTGIVQLIIEIINIVYDPFLFIEENTQPSQDRAIRNKISQIFQYCYRLLEKSAVNNEDNRMYISRWVDLFLKHSNNINQPYIQQCLVGILQNNPQSIQATINKQKINELIQSFFKQAQVVSADTFLTTKYLRLFSTFIVCQDRVIRENQNIILNQFFKNSNNKQIFRVKLQFKADYQEDPTDIMSKIKSREVLIAFGKQQFTTISKFFRDWKSKWNYFIAYINLLADICIDRNNEAIKNVSALLSLQMIATILFDPDIQTLNNQIREQNEQSIAKTGQPKFPVSNVHEPFIRIAHNLYINNDKFDPVKRIRKISRWYRNQQTEGPIIEQINRTKRVFQGQKQQEQNKFLQSILLYIKQYLNKATQGANQLSMLYTVLDLLKTTIQLGLWKSINDFRQLIPLIVMRITKIENQKFFGASEQIRNKKTPTEIVTMNKGLLKSNRPQINKSIQCKIKATQIFRQMNEFQIDIRLRYIMNFFKGLYETTQDVKAYDTSINDLLVPEASDLDKQRNKIAKQQYFKVSGKALLGEVKKVSEDQQIILKTNVWLNKLKQMTPFFYEPTSDKIADRYLFQGGILEEISQLPSQEGKNAMNIHFQNIILSLLQLPLFENYQLLNSSLKMLRSIFEQRKQLVNNFRSILICSRGNLQEVYLTLKFMRNKFQMLTNINILKYDGDEDPTFSFAIWKPYDSIVKAQEKRSGIIQDLFFLSRTLKDNISLKNIESLMRVQDETFDSSQVFSPIDERQKNNTLFQALNIAQGIYIPLMEYIKLINKEMITRKSIHYKLLRSIYQYLTQLCFNNLEAKQLMIQYVPYVLPHLSKKVGAALFIYVICYNNKTLISNQQLVKSIIEGCLEACTQSDSQNIFRMLINQFGKNDLELSKDYENSQIFYALRGIVLFNDKGYHRNQQLLMNRLQDSKFRRLIYQQNIEHRSRIDNFDLNPDECFIAAHFQMFSSLVQSGNLINIGKLQNIHPYYYCLESLKMSNRWQIRRALRSYINRLYYVNKQKDVFLFEQFIRKQFDIINNQLNDLISIHRSKSLTHEVYIKNGIRFKYALSEIMLCILEILITLNEMLLKSEFKKVLLRQLTKEEKYAESSRPLHQKMIKLYKHLGCLNKLYPQTKPISPILVQVSSLMKSVLENLQAKFIEKKNQPELQNQKHQIDEIGGQVEKKSYVYDYSKSFFRNLTNMIRDIKSKIKLQKLKEQYKRRQSQGEQTQKQLKERCLNNIYNCPNENLKPVHAKKTKKEPVYLNSQLQTTRSRAFKVIAKPQISQNEQNYQLNNRLGLVKKMVEDSPYFQKFRQQEHLFFVNILSRIDQTSSRYYAGEWQKVGEQPMPVVSMKQIITTIFTKFVENPSFIKDEQKIFVVKLIRCYITQAVQEKQDYKLSVDKWDSDYCKEDQNQPINRVEQLKKRQNLVMDCGGSDFIISILSEDLGNRLELLNETLLLSIAYLFGGNQQCQNSILDSLMGDPSNSMLLNIRKLIKKLGDFLIDVRANTGQDKKRAFNYNIVDTYDYFSLESYTMLKQFTHNSNDKYETQAQANNERALCRLFRFLQLFCENNNISMKKFLSNQINKDETRKTNSVNFIEQGCLLLRKFFKIMNNKVVSIPSYMLGFIGEITQLPCLENQISQIKSTFLQDISYLATFFEDPKNKKLRAFNEVAEDDDDPLNKLLEIYEQGVGLALSLFQGNDPVIYSEFLNKCQPKYLWIVMRNNIWFLLKQGFADEQFVSKDEDHQSAIRNTLKNLDSQVINKIIETKKKQAPVYGDRIIMILNILTIIKKVQDFGNLEQTQKQEKQKALGLREKFIESAQEEYEHITQFITKFQQLLLSIYVSSKKGDEISNQNLYFPNHPVFSFLSGQTKDYIMMEVKRDTRRDKLIDLVNFKQTIFNEIQWNYQLNYNQFSFKSYKKPFPITSDLCEKIREYARRCSYIICTLLLFLVFVDHDQEQLSSQFTFKNFVSMFIVRALCICQLILTIVYCYLWGKMRTKLALQKYHECKQEEVGIFMAPYEQAQEQKSPEGWVSIVQGIIKTAHKLGKIIQKVFNYVKKTRLWENFIEPVLALASTQSGFNSLLLFFLGSLLGNFYGVQWFTLHIFDYFANIPLLANVFKAIINNIKILVIFSLLAGAFILVFNILSFRTYTPVIYDEDLPKQACETIQDCVLQLYTSGAIGDDMDTFQLGRFFFDIIYVVFMELLFQNLVGGIMIDAFAELKDNDTARDEDKHGKCYICAMEVSDMQKNGQNFDKHIHKHYLWNYVYYIYCLEKKDQTDYTGIQYEIKNMLGSEDVSWFPFLGGDDSGVEIEGMIKQLNQKIEKIKDRSQSMISKSIQAIKTGANSLKKPENPAID